MTEPVWYGPAVGEGPAPRYGPVERVAVLSDVHANVPALEAVLDQVESSGAQLVVFTGDLTWGAEPERTVELVRQLGKHAVFVRGNAERAVIGLARGTTEPFGERSEWMAAQHSPATVDFLAGFPFTLVVEIEGLGATRFAHGSPRSDTEIVTPGTPEERFAELTSDIPERTLVTGHSHLQFDRTVAGRRSVNPGSVGLPHHDGPPGTSYWALLGPDVELRQTSYDVAEAVARGGRVGDPRAELIATMLMQPPRPAQMIEEAERLVFSD